MNKKTAQLFWSSITKVSRSNFNKPELLVLTKNSKSLIKYPNGMCRIVIHSIDLARKIDTVIEAVKHSPHSSRG